jgi:hypothetical protein
MREVRVVSEELKEIEKVNSYKQLLVWQRSMDLVETVYRITAKFPPAEQWGSYLSNATSRYLCSLEHRRRLWTAGNE